MFNLGPLGMSYPEGPDEAEWINYKNMPNETTRIPGKFVNMFAIRYLTKEDYIIIE